jgi:hypothetical protein
MGMMLRVSHDHSHGWCVENANNVVVKVRVGRSRVQLGEMGSTSLRDIRSMEVKRMPFFLTPFNIQQIRSENLKKKKKTKRELFPRDSIKMVNATAAAVVVG